MQSLEAQILEKDMALQVQSQQEAGLLRMGAQHHRRSS